MKINKKVPKRVISLLLILSMIVTPFTNLNVLKANAETTAKAATVSSATNVVVTSGSAINVKNSSYVGKGYEVSFSVDSQWAGNFNATIIINACSSSAA